MKEGIHPKYVECGSFAPAVIRGRLVRRRKTFTWKSARRHPFFTGKQARLTRRAVVERFQRKYGQKEREGFRLTADADTLRTAKKRRSRIEDRGLVEDLGSRHCARDR